jgi:hypothetical protein
MGRIVSSKLPYDNAGDGELNEERNLQAIRNKEEWKAKQILLCTWMGK